MSREKLSILISAEGTSGGGTPVTTDTSRWTGLPFIAGDPDPDSELYRQIYTRPTQQLPVQEQAAPFAKKANQNSV